MVSKTVSKFVVSDEQRRLDLKMVPSDIWGTTAHVLMLCKQQIVPEDRAQKIISALSELAKLREEGKFEIDPERGAQLTLEKEIVALAGEEAGLSAHTARSRNDQVMVTELLYLRDEVLELAEKFEVVLEKLQTLASEHTETVMPGYTHMQPGKPTTFAHWCLLYAGGLRRVLSSLYDKLDRYDSSPLGSVESFGTSWPLDREYTAKLLGFSKVWELPLDAISHRGYFQYELLQSFSLAGAEFSRFAADLLQYTTFEYALLDLGDEVAERLHPITGSSVMAQKRNPDALELLRAVGNQINASTVAAFDLLSGLPAGYNRDSRELKGYIDKALSQVHEGFAVMEKVISTLRVNKERMEELVRLNYSLTTDVADFVAQSTGLPYRKVYKIVGLAVDELMQQKKSLEELKGSRLTELAAAMDTKLEVSEDELSKVLNPSDALKRRAHIGGTAVSTTEAVIASEKQQLTVLQKNRTDWKDRISVAKQMTADAVSELLTKKAA